MPLASSRLMSTSRSSYFNAKVKVYVSANGKANAKVHDKVNDNFTDKVSVKVKVNADVNIMVNAHIIVNGKVCRGKY